MPPSETLTWTRVPAMGDNSGNREERPAEAGLTGGARPCPLRGTPHRRLVQFGEHAALLAARPRVCAWRGDLALPQPSEPIGRRQGAQSVRDREGRAAADQPVERLLNLLFRLAVDRTG